MLGWCVPTWRSVLGWCVPSLRSVLGWCVPTWRSVLGWCVPSLRSTLTVQIITHVMFCMGNDFGNAILAHSMINTFLSHF